MGFVFPLLSSKKSWVPVLIFISFSAGTLLTQTDSFLNHYLAMFLAGILYYWVKTDKISKQAFWILFALLLPVGWFAYGIQGPICAVFSVVFIHFVNKPLKPLLFVGTISYSLYLIHTIIGTDGIINFLQNYVHGTWGRFVLMIAVFPLVVAIAWLYYKLIEQPSIHLSQKIKYKQ